MVVNIYFYGYKHLTNSFAGVAPDVQRQNCFYEHTNVALVIWIIIVTSWQININYRYE